jgi:hypothetical protein
MTSDEKFIARLMFQVRILQSDGQAFQDFFVQIMQKFDLDFRPVKPHGKEGDHKNDGFSKAKGQYYQVYAPEDLGLNLTTAKKKIVESFDELLKYWDAKVATLKEYYFVMNDKYKGCYPGIDVELSALERRSKIKCDPFLVNRLEEIFLSLSDEGIQSVIGIIPDALKIQTVDYSAMTEVIKYLMRHDGAYLQETIPPNPNFDKKIIFNGLNENVASLLKFGRTQSYIIDDYFRLNSKYVKVELQKIFNQYYREAVLCQSGPVASDLVFFQILDKASPERSKAVLDAVIVLMAYYFEYCDIFETPV